MFPAGAPRAVRASGLDRLQTCISCESGVASCELLELSTMVCSFLADAREAVPAPPRSSLPS